MKPFAVILVEWQWGHRCPDIVCTSGSVRTWSSSFVLEAQGPLLIRRLIEQLLACILSSCSYGEPPNALIRRRRRRHSVDVVVDRFLQR